jgi:hypothetical protein
MLGLVALSSAGLSATIAIQCSQQVYTPAIQAIDAAVWLLCGALALGVLCLDDHAFTRVCAWERGGHNERGAASLGYAVQSALCCVLWLRRRQVSSHLLCGV